MDITRLVVGSAGLALLAFAGAVAWRFAFFVAPYAWTGEPARLFGVLQLRPGAHVADIGAGDGSLAVAIARLVGPEGLVYASELTAVQRDAIAARAARAGARQVRLVAGNEGTTNLPPACCDAIYLRAVFHHVGNQPAFARSIAAALRPGGRVAVIDFAPGALPFHGGDHGVTADAVTAAFREAGLSPAATIENWGGGMFLLAFDAPRGSVWPEAGRRSGLRPAAWGSNRGETVATAGSSMPSRTLAR